MEKTKDILKHLVWVLAGYLVCYVVVSLIMTGYIFAKIIFE